MQGTNKRGEFWQLEIWTWKSYVRLPTLHKSKQAETSQRIFMEYLMNIGANKYQGRPTRWALLGNALFQNFPMISQDLSRRSIVTSGESVSMYPHRPKAEAFSNAVDVVERLQDPTDPSTERTTPPCSAHVQHVTSLELLIQLRTRESSVIMAAWRRWWWSYRRRASPKHYDDMTEVLNCGGGTAHG